MALTIDQAIKKWLNFLSNKELNAVLRAALNRSRGTIRQGQSLAIGSAGTKARITPGTLKKVFDYNKAKTRGDGKGAFQQSKNSGKTAGNVSIFKFNPTIKKIPLKPLRKLKKKPPKGKRRRPRQVLTSVVLPGDKRIKYGTTSTNYLFVMGRKGKTGGRRKGKNRLGMRRSSKNPRGTKDYLRTGNFNLAYWLLFNKKAFFDTAKFYEPQFFKTFNSALKFAVESKRSRILARLISKNL